MKRVVVTGLGFITSIGNNRHQVLRSLQECRTGIEPFPEFAGADTPVKLAGTVKGFQFPTAYFEDWTFPSEYQLAREQLRPMAPNSLYAYGASNFFELAVAAAISLFGLESGAALATVVGVLIEVPVMLSVVRIVNASRGWYERRAPRTPAAPAAEVPR